VVLTFDSATASDEHTIWVKALDDGAAEGPRVALISHSILSADPDFNDLPLVDIFVNIVDNDQPGLELRHLTDGFQPDVSTEVLEAGFNDAYDVVLTKAPGAGEIVTVNLLTDGQVTALSQVGSHTWLTFNQANWFIPQRVIVSAVEDGLDGVELSSTRHQVMSNGVPGSVYTNFTDQPALSVTVYDNETPGVIVQETGGSTVVVEGGATDTYRVRLTAAPADGTTVTLTLRTDKQTFLDSSAAGWQVLDESGTKAYFEYSFTFNSTNWDDWLEIEVSANLAYAGTDSVLKVFPPQGQNLDQIRGPLIIEGGLGAPVASRSLQPPVLLPGETNSESVAEGSNPAGEPGGIDTLNVFHTDNSDPDTGRLYYRSVDGLAHSIENVGLALTGFEMGGDLAVNQGSTEASDLLYYGGGITYNGFEIVEVLLGKGNETLTIDDTGDRDEKDPLVTTDPATITAIHGGGGNDTIFANNRGDGPLVLYGDTSEDGFRYSNAQPAASVYGTKFNNPGIDTINASAMPVQNDGFVGVVIYGGARNDVISGSQDDDRLAGGFGNDTIYAQGGNDHVYGDAAFNVDLLLFAQDQVARFPTNDARVAAMFTVLTTPSPGSDQLYGNGGADIILGDQGIISLAAGIRRIETVSSVERVETSVENLGGVDTIEGNAGDDIILGGHAGDTIAGNEGNNIILGDHGYIDYVVADSELTDIDAIASTSTTAFGGVDQITAGSGQDIVIGGRFGDTINAGDGDNVVIGDSGKMLAAASGSPQLSGLPITLGTVETTEVADGGNDTIVTGSGKDIVLGGAASDDIRTGANDDIVHGDNAALSWIVDGNASTLDVVSTTANSIGGIDTIRGEAGGDVLIGGAYGDQIDGGSERDLIFGDNVRLDRAIGDSANNVRYRTLTGAEGGQIYSTIPATADTVLVNADSSAIPGGAPAWESFNIELLDHDFATQSAAGSNFGSDYIAGGAGDDEIFGELGNDVIQGDGSIDLVVGATRLADGTLSVRPSVEAVTD
jgi:Ca2+-binding RTX toxin-like protein